MEGDHPRRRQGYSPVFCSRSIRTVDVPVAGVNLLDGSSFRLTLPEGKFPIALSREMLPGYTFKAFTYGTVNLLKEPLKVSPDGQDQLRIVLEPSRKP